MVLAAGGLEARARADEKLVAVRFCVKMGECTVDIKVGRAAHSCHLPHVAAAQPQTRAML